MIFFLCRYSRDDRFADKRFAAQYVEDKYHYYNPALTIGQYHYSDQVTLDILTDILLVIDMVGKSRPSTWAKYTLIFGAPNPDQYLKFIIESGGDIYTVPTWSENELCLVNPDTLV